jgi:hypothetical protein
MLGKGGDEVIPVTVLDGCAPRFDFTMREHLTVEALPAATFVPLGRLGSAQPQVFGLAVPPVPPVRPSAGVPGFDEILATANWAVLGRRAGVEVVLGAAGRFWTPFMDWQTITPEDFATFARPRRATIAISLGVRPYGLTRTLLTFEARARATDPVAYRWADWYWHTIKPTARLVIRDLLHGVRHAASQAVPPRRS